MACLGCRLRLISGDRDIEHRNKRRAVLARHFGLIDHEAVELAKNYEEPETVAFINGVLGGFMRGERAAAPEES